MTTVRCHCRSCRYDLAGLAAGPCPECGVLFDPSNPETFTDLRAPRGIIIASLLLAAFPWASVLAMYGAWCVGRLHLGY